MPLSLFHIFSTPQIATPSDMIVQWFQDMSCAKSWQHPFCSTNLWVKETEHRCTLTPYLGWNGKKARTLGTMVFPCFFIVKCVHQNHPFRFLLGINHRMNPEVPWQQRCQAGRKTEAVEMNRLTSSKTSVLAFFWCRKFWCLDVSSKKEWQ